MDSQGKVLVVDSLDSQGMASEADNLDIQDLDNMDSQVADLDDVLAVRDVEVVDSSHRCGHHSAEDLVHVVEDYKLEARDEVADTPAEDCVLAVHDAVAGAVDHFFRRNAVDWALLAESDCHHFLAQELIVQK